MSDRYRDAHAPVAPTWSPAPPTLPADQIRALNHLTRTSCSQRMIDDLAALCRVPGTNADTVLARAIAIITASKTTASKP